MKKQKYNWLSCYIYYDDNADILLIQKVWPLVQKILKNKYATHFFFIRYHDKIGPHIRLRFLGKEALLEEKVKPLLQKNFPKIRFVAYRRELQRYGWKNGIIIAEELFEVSSRMVLTFLAENNQSSYERSLGFALQANISMAHAFGMDKKEAIAFFDHASSYSHTKEYDTQLNKQKDILLPFLANLWSSLEQNAKFDKPWFNTWLDETTVAVKKLQDAYQNNKLRYVDEHNGHPQNHLWQIYESYIHMNNNRLGIANFDEPYIAYILKKALEYK